MALTQMGKRWPKDFTVKLRVFEADALQSNRTSGVDGYDIPS